ncbi:hypothetical protein HQ587_04040 [bacterium]|nr:hypothetical protein [bacterium]
MLGITVRISIAETWDDDDKLSSRVNFLETSFTKGLNYQSLHGEYQLDRDLSGGGLLIFHETIALHLHEVPGYRKRWKVDQRLMFGFSHPINKTLRWSLNGDQERFYLSDVSDMGSRYVSLGIGYWAVKKRLKANFSTGPLSEQRGENRQQGIHLDGDLQSNWSSGSLTTHGWLERLPSGYDQGWTSTLMGEHSFTDEASDNYTISFNHHRQRVFNPSDEVAGYRRDEQFNIHNELRSGKGRPLCIRWNSDLTRRIVHDNAYRAQSDYDNTWKNKIQATIDEGGFRIAAFAGLDLQDMEYSEVLGQGRRNYIGLYSGFEGNLLDTSGIEARVMKYRFDTPDESDFNDRDELRYLFTLQGGKQLIPNLGVRFKLEADLTHLVYLYGQRSAENRWTRIFSLSCELPWRDDFFSNIARFSLVSNYNVYDFSQSDQTMSRVYRFFSAEDSLRIYLTPHSEVEMDVGVLLDEHGRFSWSEWVEKVSEDGYNVSATIAYTYKAEDIDLRIGWAMNQRYSWQHLTDDRKIRGDAVRSTGPVASINARLANRLTAEIDGHLLHVMDSSGSDYLLPDIQCSLTWVF